MQDGISLTRAHLEKYSLAPADRYRTTDVRLHPGGYPLLDGRGHWVREMLHCPILLNVSRSGRHLIQPVLITDLAHLERYYLSSVNIEVTHLFTYRL